MVYAVLAIALGVGLLTGLWLTYGRGPRRTRAYRRARRLLSRGAWTEALALAKKLQATTGLAPVWQESIRTLFADCHQFAADSALKERRFEDALEQGRLAAVCLGQDTAEQENQVVERMLAEARRLFSVRDTDAVVQLLQRTFAIRAPCPEGSFWLGMSRVREGDINAAMALLTAAHEQSGKQFLDPAFYIGLLLRQRGQAQEALRYLSEANRVDGACPFVIREMGITLVAAGGDPGLAARALRRALGPRGLSMWLSAPDRAWVEAFPEGRSYVRRLAEHHLYVCPVLGSDLEVLLRQGRQALGEALLRLGQYQESADIFGGLLQEIPPTEPLVRGLGLALARLQRYDQAYKHLRTALETEQPKDPLTAAYLALCGAMAPPTQPDDKPKNVNWALRLLARYPLVDNVEWVGILSQVHAEALAQALVIGVEDQVLLCDALTAVRQVDVPAVAAYRRLAASYPEAVKPAHAWLFARAAATGASVGAVEPCDARLFARAFADRPAAREFFESNGWDFGDAEYAYLESHATLTPGSYPEVPGGDYAARGETFLLERSLRAEKAGDAAAAQRTAETFLRLAPQNPAAHDRLACLLFRKGDYDRTVALLEGWQRLRPDDYRPIVRQAIVEQHRSNPSRRTEAIDRALQLTHGRLRAAIAFLGARLALREFVRTPPNGTSNGVAGHAPSPALAQALQLLNECLREDPDHSEARWCLAAVRSIGGEQSALADQGAAMDRPEVRDGRFHYLAAVCALAAGDYGDAHERVRRAAFADPGLAGEAYYLSAQIYLRQGYESEARTALERAAATDGPSAGHARAMLGRLCFARGEHAEAVRWWKAVDPAFRAACGFDEPLRQTALLAALNDLAAERFVEAADRLREAGRLGLRDRRLGPLLARALVQAGRKLLYREEDDATGSPGR